MPDQLDQLSDAQTHASQGSSTRTTHVFTFVYQLNGRWYDVTYEGPLSDCTDAVMAEVAKRGASLDKLRWARGHKDGRQLVIHPKTDAQAEARITQVMSKQPKVKQLPPEFRRD